jgi:hypothetical protein
MCLSLLEGETCPIAPSTYSLWRFRKLLAAFLRPLIISNCFGLERGLISFRKTISDNG